MSKKIIANETKIRVNPQKQLFLCFIAGIFHAGAATI
jgi:hypothetical protein